MRTTLSRRDELATQGCPPLRPCDYFALLTSARRALWIFTPEN